MIKIRYVNLSVKNKNLRKDYIQTLKNVDMKIYFRSSKFA